MVTNGVCVQKDKLNLFLLDLDEKSQGMIGFSLLPRPWILKLTKICILLFKCKLKRSHFLTCLVYKQKGHPDLERDW